MAKLYTRLLIIDGYNVLRSGGRYETIEGEDYTDDWFNRAREALINDVALYIPGDTQAIIVFDGGGNPHSTGDYQAYGSVSVMFSPTETSADKVIEKLCYKAKLQGVKTSVVTSDSSIQEAVFGDGVVRLSAREFSRELAQHTAQASIDDLHHEVPKNTIARRIDETTRQRLIALRDSSKG